MATKGNGLEFDVLAGSAGYLLPAIQVGKCYLELTAKSKVSASHDR